MPPATVVNYLPMTARKIRATVTRRREFRAFAELSHAHRVIVENAKARRDGWPYECLAANVFAAFKIEAYFNHIGPLMIPDWEKNEKGHESRWSWHKKLKQILDRVRIAPDGDKRFETVNEVFKLRDEVAHGRSETLNQKESIETDELEVLRRRRPQKFWEERSTVEFAEEAYAHSESVIRQVHTAAGRDDAELNRSGHSYSIKTVGARVHS